MIEGRKLTEIINEDHENVKYLPGVKLPENVIAVPELLDAARDADLFIFVIPHQFISRLVGQMKGNIKEGAAAISLIKGINITGEFNFNQIKIYDVCALTNFQKMVLVLSLTRFVKVLELMFLFLWEPTLPMKLPAINSVNQLLVVLAKMQKFSKSFSNDLLSGNPPRNSAWDGNSDVLFQSIDQ